MSGALFETILFPINFSKRCELAARNVAAYAREFHSRVILLHVVELPDFLFGMPEYNVISFSQIRDEQVESAKVRMETWCAHEFEGIKIERLVVQGDAAGEIVGHADEESASLIMMPSHGVGPFRRFMIGSTVAKVLHDAHVPVWTDTHTQDVPEVGDVKSVVCALDLGPHSESTLRMADMIAKNTGAEVTIAHAIPAIEVRPINYFDNEFSAQLSSEARDVIDEMQKVAGTSFRVCIHGGEPSDVVRQAAFAHKAELVLIARGAILGGLGRLRTHAYSIINKSPVPVLSV